MALSTSTPFVCFYEMSFHGFDVTEVAKSNILVILRLHFFRKLNCLSWHSLICFGMWRHVIECFKKGIKSDFYWWSEPRESYHEMAYLNSPPGADSDGFGVSVNPPFPFDLKFQSQEKFWIYLINLGYPFYSKYWHSLLYHIFLQ